MLGYWLRYAPMTTMLLVRCLILRYLMPIALLLLLPIMDLRCYIAMVLLLLHWLISMLVTLP